MQYGICNLSLVPLRAEASDKSEMLSQLLFGDSFIILNTTEKWVNIKTSSDEYVGWIDSKQYQPVDEEYYEKQKNARILGPVFAQAIKKGSIGELIHLAAGSSIPEEAQGSFSLGTERYFYDSDLVFGSRGIFQQQVINYSRFFLNSPYLWGGKSVFGIDCSGLTQVVFKMLDISLKRDAWQQAEQGEVVNFLQEVKPGDLAFFDNAEGRITHVGIMLNEHQIIHASGRVKIDPIDDQGIYSLDLKKHSHKLRIIKRYV
ncbi:C40 family peptidase [Desertivirga xinjiangensis]|uniref:C40 family peptidase n=1 Tax=Desertivirga xinjiangensis TaxID=539206 RepID=UPI0021090500|nr:C40 family peptidase [Pedobacter xinjiangensis]